MTYPSSALNLKEGFLNRFDGTASPSESPADGGSGVRNSGVLIKCKFLLLLLLITGGVVVSEDSTIFGVVGDGAFGVVADVVRVVFSASAGGGATLSQLSVVGDVVVAAVSLLPINKVSVSSKGFKFDKSKLLSLLGTGDLSVDFVGDLRKRLFLTNREPPSGVGNEDTLTCGATDCLVENNVPLVPVAVGVAPGSSGDVEVAVQLTLLINDEEIKILGEELLEFGLEEEGVEVGVINSPSINSSSPFVANPFFNEGPFASME